jgi:hypothetical protein
MLTSATPTPHRLFWRSQNPTASPDFCFFEITPAKKFLFLKWKKSGLSVRRRLAAETVGSTRQMKLDK